MESLSTQPTLWNSIEPCGRRKGGAGGELAFPLFLPFFFHRAIARSEMERSGIELARGNADGPARNRAGRAKCGRDRGESVFSPPFLPFGLLFYEIPRNEIEKFYGMG